MARRLDKDVFIIYLLIIFICVVIFLTYLYDQKQKTENGYGYTDYITGPEAYEWIENVKATDEVPRNPPWQLVLVLKQMKIEIDALKEEIAELKPK